MEDEKRRNQTPTVRKINYSKLLLFSKISFKNIKIIIYHQNQHQKKHILNLKKANSHKKKLLEEKDKKVQEL